MSLPDALLKPVVRGLPALPRLVHRAHVIWANTVRRFSLGVRILVTDENQVLLVRHSYLDGWMLPGGSVDRGETIWDAAIRELREETGLRARTCGSLLGLYANFRHGENHVALVSVTAWEGPIRTDGIEIVEARFFPLNGLPLGTSSATHRRLAEVHKAAAISAHW